MATDLELVLPERKMHPGPVSPLERAQIRVPLILSLAAGETQVELAELYGFSQVAISKFAKRHAPEIEAQRRDLEDKFGALWIAQKAVRVGAYQDDVAAIDAVHDAMAPAVDPQLLGAKHRALRNVAEELGALRTVIDSTVQVRYELIGVDPEALR